MREGLIEEALRHFLAAGEVDVLAALVERHFRALIDDGVHSGKDLERWVALFPPAAVSQRPILLVAQAYQHLFQWDYRRIEALLDQADTLLRDPACVLSEASRHSLRGDIATIYGSCLYQKGDMDGVVSHAQRTRQVRPRENGFTYIAYALSGRRDEALRLLAQDLAVDVAQGSRHTGRLLTMRMIISFYAGDLAAVEQSAQQMLALHETVTIPDWWLSNGQYFLGQVAYERNVLDTAAEHVARVEAMPYRVNPLLYHDEAIQKFLALIP